MVSGWLRHEVVRDGQLRTWLEGNNEDYDG